MIHLRLSRVCIENLPYGQIISRYDKPQTFFYLDPPYFGCEAYYGKDIFSREDFSVLASLLSSITGKFILSINDTPEIRRLFGAFRITEIPTAYQQAGAHRRKKVVELLVMNY